MIKLSPYQHSGVIVKLPPEQSLSWKGGCGRSDGKMDDERAYCSERDKAEDLDDLPDSVKDEVG